MDDLKRQERHIQINRNLTEKLVAAELQIAELKDKGWYRFSHKCLMIQTMFDLTFVVNSYKFIKILVNFFLIN